MYNPELCVTRPNTTDLMIPLVSPPKSLITYLALVASCALCLPDRAEAAEIEFWRFQTSVHTAHFDSEPDHSNHQKLINLETWLDNGWHFGLAFFDNSYKQSSQYIYAGKSWRIADSEMFYWRLTGGLVHGYKEPYEDKIPLNGLGVAPVLIPSAGLKYKRVFAEVQLLGLSATMVTVGVTFGH